MLLSIFVINSLLYHTSFSLSVVFCFPPPSELGFYSSIMMKILTTCYIFSLKCRQLADNKCSSATQENINQFCWIVRSQRKC